MYEYVHAATHLCGVIAFLLLLRNVILVWQFGYTPLHVAAGNNNTDVVNLLISYGADVNVRDNVSSAFVLMNDYVTALAMIISLSYIPIYYFNDQASNMCMTVVIDAITNTA